MRSVITYSSGVFLILGLFSCKSNKVALENLEGSWLLSKNRGEQELEYQRIEGEKDHFGSILNIARDSTICDSFVMKCINGTGKTTLFSEGTWSIDEKTMILTSTVPIDLSGTNFKIVQLDSKRFILAKVEMKK